MNKTLVLAIGVALAAGLAACTTTSRQAGLASSQCDDIRFPIYFEEQSAALTQPATQAIAISAQQARNCKVRRVAVTGLGDGQDATDLSRQRAATVVGALTAQGLPKPDVSIEKGALRLIRLSRTRTAQAIRQPTEVVITFQR